jgi:hypothetical protein
VAQNFHFTFAENLVAQVFGELQSQRGEHAR